MARVPALLPFTLLEELYNKVAQGVPILRLKREYNIDAITFPTLAKHIRYYETFRKSLDSGLFKGKVYASLNPPWREEDTETLFLKPPKGWYYQGIMPYGSWKQRGKSDDE